MSKIKSISGAVAVTIAASVLVSSAVSATEDPTQPDRVEVGQEAPLFKLRPLDGERLSLAEVRGVKPVVLIFFRGTW